MAEVISAAELRRRKADKLGDSREWTTQDLLEDLLDQLRKGEIAPAQIAVHWFERAETGGLRHHYGCAGLTYADHLSLLEIAKHRLLNEWIER